MLATVRIVEMIARERLAPVGERQQEPAIRDMRLRLRLVSEHEGEVIARKGRLRPSNYLWRVGKSAAAA